jgi:hypothetical protein
MFSAVAERNAIMLELNKLGKRYLLCFGDKNKVHLNLGGEGLISGSY